jgi:hypothetical protein
MTNFLMIKHIPKAGFFSCCFVRLNEIINFFNTRHKLPDKVFGNDFFQFCKTPQTVKDDYTNYFFIEEKTMNLDIPYKTPIQMSDSEEELQLSDYGKINFKKLTPFIERYFTPSKEVFEKVSFLKKKYNFIPSHFCLIRYRGTDKILETNKPKYDDFIAKVQTYRFQNPHIQYVILTDEYDFLVKFKKYFPETILFKETAQKINTVDAAQWYLASVYLLAQCRNIICTSGNGELFLSLYRGGADGVTQYLNRKEYIYNVKNIHYKPVENSEEYWIEN